MKQMIKLGLTLSAYAVAACILLAVTNNLTKPVIEARAQALLKASLGEVFADAADFEELKVQDEGVTAFYSAKNADGKVIGSVVIAEGKSYDHAKIAIGFKNDAEMTITGMKFLELTDSPGFGQRAADPSEKVKCGKTFYGQFAGKKAADGFILNETYDAVSGATITSTSVGKILTKASASAKRNAVKNQEGSNE